MRNKKLIILFSIFLGVTLLIVLNSVIFSVQHIDLYCQNIEDVELEENVRQNNKIKKGQSIFLMNEQKAIEDIESRIPNMRIINIEKKFPNRVSINYVKIFEYLELESENMFYFCSNDGKIVRQSDISDGSHIKVKMNGNMSSKTVGEKFQSDNSYEVTLLFNILYSLERLDYREAEVKALFESIDITNREVIFLQTRSGVKFQINQTSNLLTKLRSAISLYLKDNAYKTSGTIIVTNDNPKGATYEPNIIS